MKEAIVVIAGLLLFAAATVYSLEADLELPAPAYQRDLSPEEELYWRIQAKEFELRELHDQYSAITGASFAPLGGHDNE